MKKVFQKNYIILVILLVVTVFITLFLADIYTSKNKLVSNFYEYSNKIKPQEFNEFILETPDAIVYISNKYNLTNETFEKSLQDKISNLNLKENLVFIDTNEIKTEFIEQLKTNYGVYLELEKTPMIIVIVNNKVIKSIYIENDLSVDNIIDYGVFE